jgi:hypothetical protein
MRFKIFMGLGLALAVASTSAFAFQEQKADGAPTPGATAPAAPEAQAKDPGKDLEFSAPQAESGAAAGTEVRIPGLGKLGVLPKMDFGLELLYGASEAKQPEPERDSPADDLTIRGTVKHNF